MMGIDHLVFPISQFNSKHSMHCILTKMHDQSDQSQVLPWNHLRLTLMPYCYAIVKSLM
uniref:Uncharacterized protein n=1 Tax=Arundo donax TaxID=35708 RepID=A0A0A9BQ51_ARUDO